MEITLLYIIISLATGVIITWLSMKAKIISSVQNAIDDQRSKYSDLEREFAGFRSSAETKLSFAADKAKSQLDEIQLLKMESADKRQDILKVNAVLATSQANEKSLNQ